MYPIFCALCLIEGKPLPELGTPLHSPRIRELAAVVVLDGMSMCKGHMDKFLETGWTRKELPR